MEFDTVVLSRLQFAFTIAFHIIFPSVTIGLAGFLAVLEGLWLATRRDVYVQLYLFWLKLFAIMFCLGVLSGIVMIYQYGMNWSRFSHATGNVLGPLLGYQIVISLFLEASFLAIMLFGWSKVGRGVHFFATLMVAAGTIISTFWFLAANSWMQTPAGYELKDGVFFVTDWMAVIFNPSMPYRLVHMVLASYLTTGFVIAGISALALLWNSQARPAATALKMALGMVMIVLPLQFLAGHGHGLNVYKFQPAKLAAIAGYWETKPGQPLILFAMPDMAHERNRSEFGLPRLGSLAVAHSTTAVVHGLKEIAVKNRPPVLPVFWAFRVMVGIGLLMLLMALWGGSVMARRALADNRAFQFACVFMIPSGFVAVLAGWIVAEVGRQPYTVYGLLRTVDSVSPIEPNSVAMSLMVFMSVYAVLFTAALYYLWRLIVAGPPEADALFAAGIVPMSPAEYDHIASFSPTRAAKKRRVKTKGVKNKAAKKHTATKKIVKKPVRAKSKPPGAAQK